MATFTNHTRRNNAVSAFQWHTADGEQLPYVKYDTAGGYYYFDNQEASNNLFPITSGSWVVEDGSGPSTLYYVLSDNQFRAAFNP